MAEIYDEGQHDDGPGFDFEAAETQFHSDGLAGVALEGFGMSGASYPAYSNVETNQANEVRWAGQPNSLA